MIRKKRAPRRPASRSHRLKFDHRLVLTSWMLDLFDATIKVWQNQRRGERRICLWFEQESYLVILSDRGSYVLPWTAYLVEQPHRQRKLQKEYEEYWRNKGQKG